ncbi:DUF6265 family protein [Croceivirga sp. JEA036]|uniref:DUF6265 family protein n=1 Tax=Croceivirga sp. JEA036 TaxID=2721162 RepID=UPI00143B52DA|nr:DUF6265 family protein [Croceivirga sp. JEA036]NJB36460.1 hypothetical protein [Croceivirga sp. JEA036]
MSTRLSIILVIVCILFGTTIKAQKTKQLGEGDAPAPALLSEITWLEGHWRGEAFGGIAEEIWSPPLGDSMFFSFRLIDDEGVQFYELGHIIQQENSLLLQLKHFSKDLKGWETKDETVDFKLVDKDKNAFYFEGFTIERIDKNHINMYVLIDEGDLREETVFSYKKYRP